MENVNFDILIVTGVSGAGKSEAVNILEDLGAFCVDNLPPSLLSQLIELRIDDATTNFIAIVIDVRTEQNFDVFLEELKWLENSKYNHKILFLDCADDKLIKRFMESRRTHPLYKQGEKRLYDYISDERERLSKIRKKADFIIDTSQLKIAELRNYINSMLFNEAGVQDLFVVELMSFGYKHGVPLDADIIFDVRFVPNPYYVERLKFKTGNNKEVQEYVYQWPETKKFIKSFTDLIYSLIPEYIEEGKNKISIALGCTGGVHRSVALVNKLNEHFSQNYKTKKTHRDKPVEDDQ